jgi:hypothetical protein
MGASPHRHFPPHLTDHLLVETERPPLQETVYGLPDLPISRWLFGRPSMLTCEHLPFEPPLCRDSRLACLDLGLCCSWDLLC